MAVTPITTISVVALSPFPGGYSLDVLDRMFLYGESPCQVATVSSTAAATAWTSADEVTLISAPGAGKSIYLWGADGWINDTAQGSAVVVLAEGAQTSTPIVGGIAAIPCVGSALPHSQGIRRIGHLVTANTAVSGTYIGAGTALVKLRFFYAIIG